MEQIPDDILTSATKVFSKHSRFEVKKWANMLMKHYHLMVSTEKPMNLDYARPFSNTSDLAKNVPEVSPATASEKAKHEKDYEGLWLKVLPI